MFYFGLLAIPLGLVIAIWFTSWINRLRKIENNDVGLAALSWSITLVLGIPMGALGHGAQWVALACLFAPAVVVFHGVTRLSFERRSDAYWKTIWLAAYAARPAAQPEEPTHSRSSLGYRRSWVRLEMSRRANTPD
jgi:hypothetical protein